MESNESIIWRTLHNRLYRMLIVLGLTAYFTTVVSIAIGDSTVLPVQQGFMSGVTYVGLGPVLIYEVLLFIRCKLDCHDGRVPPYFSSFWTFHMPIIYFSTIIVGTTIYSLSGLAKGKIGNDPASSGFDKFNFYLLVIISAVQLIWYPIWVALVFNARKSSTSHSISTREQRLKYYEMKKNDSPKTKYLLSHFESKFDEVKMEEITQCAICLTDFVAQDTVNVLPCNQTHVFHSPCIENWLVKTQHCPMCRKRVCPKGAERRPGYIELLSPEQKDLEI